MAGASSALLLLLLAALALGLGFVVQQRFAAYEARIEQLLTSVDALSAALTAKKSTDPSTTVPEAASEWAKADATQTPPTAIQRPTTLRRLSDTGEYEIIARARAAERRPSISMPNVTLVTHVTADRAERLASLCRTWRGPMSVAVYEKPGEAPGWAVETVAAMDECLRRHADLHTVRAVRAEGAGTDMFAHYPFNVQRNAALDGAVGEWVLLLDADFVITPSEAGRERVFSSRLHELREQHAALLGDDAEERDRAVLVVPAVETVTKEVAPPTSLAGLRDALARHEVCAFYGHYCKACHLPSNVERYASGGPKGAPYVVEYEEGYEPYVAVSRKHLPRYDEAFTGRGGSKVSFMYHLAMLGRRFFVLPPPFPFLVHSGRGDDPMEFGTVEFHRKFRANREVLSTFKYRLQALATNGFGGLRGAFAAAQVRLFKLDSVVPRYLVNVSHSGFGLQDLATTAAATAVVAPELRIGHGGLVNTTAIHEILDRGCARLHADTDCPWTVSARFFPTNIIMRADRVLHRFLMRYGRQETRKEFGNAVHFTACRPQCEGCRAIRTATVQQIHGALTWLCAVTDHDPYIDCDALRQIAMQPESTELDLLNHNGTVARHAHPLRRGATSALPLARRLAEVLFTAFVSLGRCVPEALLGETPMCSFNGIAESVACGRLFEDDDIAEP